MPISHKNKIVFVHIPKNAGTSITISKELGFTHVEHKSAKSYIIDTPDYWRDYLKVAIVRNPWDRFVSCYEYARMPFSYWHSNDERQSEFGPHSDYEVIKELKFTEFARSFAARQVPLSHPCWSPQYRWICDDNFKILVDKVFRYEDISTDKEFKNIFGNIEKVNSSNRGNYKDYYDEETKEIVRETYKKDIEIFNYSF